MSNYDTQNVRIELLEEGEYFASMTDHQSGLWGTGPTEDAALDELVDVLRDAAQTFPEDF
jgi:hypothetical protein